MEHRLQNTSSCCANSKNWHEMKQLLKKFYIGNSQDDSSISVEMSADEKPDLGPSVTPSVAEIKPFDVFSGWLTKHNQVSYGTSQQSIQDGSAQQSQESPEGQGLADVNARVMGRVDEAKSVSDISNSPFYNEGKAGADIQSLDEEYQVQLAMALSVCHSDNMDREVAEIEAAKKISLGVSEAVHQAEVIAFKYWVDNIIDYDDRLVDGFYDIYGVACDSNNSEKIPSLVDLQGRPATDLISCEVVLVNKGTDDDLVTLEEKAKGLAAEYQLCAINSVKSGLAQKIGELVAARLGGPIESEVEMLTLWRKSSEELRAALGSNIIPLGCLKFGLARHRALLFKVLCDSIGIPCRLVKGKHYTGAEEGAHNFIKDFEESEYIIDLMGAPGCLIPPEASGVSVFSQDNLQTQLPSVQSEHSARDEKVEVDRAEPHLGVKCHSEPLELEELSMNPRPIIPRYGYSHSHLRSPSWTEGIGSHVARELKAKDMSRYMLNAAKDNPELAQKLHNVLRESGVAAPPELFSEISTQQLQVQAKEDKKANEKKSGKEKTKLDEVQQGRNKGRPPPAVTKQSHLPLEDATQDRLPRLQSVEGLGERRPLEPSSAISTSVASSSATASVLAAVQEHLPSELMKRVPVAAASAITAAVVASSMVVAAVKSEVGQDANLEVPITAAATATAAIVAATSAAAGLRIDSGENSPNKGSDKNVEGEQIKCDDSEVNCKASPNNSPNPAESRESETVSGEDQSLGQLGPLWRTNTQLLHDEIAEFEIPWEEIVIGDRIGLGSYGEVYHGEWHGTEIAVKKFLDQDITGDALEEFRSEVRLMRRMRHPNVVLFMGAVTRPPNLSIVTEFLARGSLYKLLHRSNSLLDERRRLRMALDVAKGMNYLHSCTPMIVHRDLKSPNLLVDKNWVVKVCDFGLSRMKHHTFLSSKSTAGTPEWMAPEVLRNEPSNEKADVYSFGVILWELTTLRRPWSDLNAMQVVGAVGFQNRRLDIPDDMDPHVAKIIQDCFLSEPQMRPSFAEIMSALKPLQKPISASQLRANRPSSATAAAAQLKPDPVAIQPQQENKIWKTDVCIGKEAGEGVNE